MLLALLQEGVAVSAVPVLRAARTRGQPDGAFSGASDSFCAKSPDHRGVTSRDSRPGKWRRLLSPRRC